MSNTHRNENEKWDDGPMDEIEAGWRSFQSRCDAEAARLTDDPLLRLVYSHNFFFQYGHNPKGASPEPYELDHPSVHDGISFYLVGRNASHQFYLGAKDGHLYRASYDCMWEPCDRCSAAVERVHHVEEWTMEFAGKEIVHPAHDLTYFSSCDDWLACPLQDPDYPFEWSVVENNDLSGAYLGHL